jgi:hypothetical protein
MKDKIEIDGRFYDNNKELWYLINSCLGEKPQRVVATYYAAGGPGGLYDPTDFLRYLDRTYLDSDIQAAAAATLKQLRQGEATPLAAFLPRFEQVLAEAGGGGWADSAKIAFLEGALNSKIRQALVYVDLPADYQDYLRKLQTVAGRVERLVRSEKIVARPRTTEKQDRGSEKDHEGDVQMGGVRSLEKKTKKKKKERQTIVSNDSGSDKETTRPARRCFLCDKPGHIVATCPDRSDLRKKDKQKQKHKSAKVKAKKAESPESDTDSTQGYSGRESESENE